VAFGAANVAVEPCRNRKLTEPVPTEDTQLRFEHRCHHEHKDESDERNDEVDCETTDGQHQPNRKTEPYERGPSS
jgi:hypothetical protein